MANLSEQLRQAAERNVALTRENTALTAELSRYVKCSECEHCGDDGFFPRCNRLYDQYGHRFVVYDDSGCSFGRKKIR